MSRRVIQGIKTPTEIKAERLVDEITAGRGQCISADVQLIQANHQDPNGRSRVGYGPLIRLTPDLSTWLVDQENPEAVQELVEIKERLKQLEADGKAWDLWQHGKNNPVYFITPRGLQFWQNVKYTETAEGNFKMLMAILSGLMILEFWQLLYLPVMDEMAIGDMFFNTVTYVLATALLVGGVTFRSFAKKTTAYAAQMICSKPHSCDKTRLHWGVFVGAKNMTEDEQFQFWHDINEDLPDLAEYIEEGLIQEVEASNTRARESEIKAQIASVKATDWLMERLRLEGFISVESKHYRFLQLAILTLFTLFIVAAVLAVGV